jgi:hypothetical protein
MASVKRRKLDTDKTVSFQVANSAAVPGATIKVPLRVAGFERVDAVQFTLQWDPAVLRFVGLADFGLRGLLEENFNPDLGPGGKLPFAWHDPYALGASLADGGALFAVNFEVIGNPGSASTIALVDSPTDREVVISLDLAGFVSQHGQVRVQLPSPTLTAKLDPPHALLLSLPTVEGAEYTVEFTDTLPANKWIPLEHVIGDGTLKAVFDTCLTNQQRFYRVRISP